MREYRAELQIHVSGYDPPRPVKTFGQAGFDHLLLGAIKKAGYQQPTAIQAQALPAALSGRDVLVRAGAGCVAACLVTCQAVSCALPMFCLWGGACMPGCVCGAVPCSAQQALQSPSFGGGCRSCVCDWGLVKLHSQCRH